LEKKFIIYLIVFAKSILFLDATRYDRWYISTAIGSVWPIVQLASIMHFLVLLSALVACAAGKCYNRLYSSKYLHGKPLSDKRESNILYIYICNIIKDNLLNTGFGYHRARFSLVSLDDTLNRIWARKFGAPKTGLCVTPALDHAENPVSVFP
jgi:hypothetical protein